MTAKLRSRGQKPKGLFTKAEFKNAVEKDWQTCSPAWDSPMMKRSPGPSAAKEKERFEYIRRAKWLKIRVIIQEAASQNEWMFFFFYDRCNAAFVCEEENILMCLKLEFKMHFLL